MPPKGVRAMAQAAATLGEDFDLVLSRYLRGLARQAPSPAAAASPGHDLRICPGCGHRAAFSLDPEGIWYRCHRCGHYA